MNKENLLYKLNLFYNKRKANGFVINFNNCLSNILLIKLCSKTNLPTYLIYNEDIDNDFRDFILKYNVKIINDNVYVQIIENADGGKLSVSSLNKCELKWLRNYKHFSVMADVFLFKDYKKSEIDKFFESFIEGKFEKEIFDNNPRMTDMIEGYDFTYEELEWADGLDSNILINDIDPSKDPKWFLYTPRQKKIIAKIHQIEKQTRFKCLI